MTVRIITPSKNTADDLESLLGLSGRNEFACCMMACRIFFFGYHVACDKIDDADICRLGRVADRDLRYFILSVLHVSRCHRCTKGSLLAAIEAGGTPVIAGRVCALPEVTAGAAVRFDPLNPQAIADGIRRSIDEGAQLSGAGRACTKESTWGRTAAGTIAVYRELS